MQRRNISFVHVFWFRNGRKCLTKCFQPLWRNRRQDCVGFGTTLLRAFACSSGA